jgi:hypothetical protein
MGSLGHIPQWSEEAKPLVRVRGFAPLKMTIYLINWKGNLSGKN